MEDQGMAGSTFQARYPSKRNNEAGEFDPKNGAPFLGGHITPSLLEIDDQVA